MASQSLVNWSELRGRDNFLACIQDFRWGVYLVERGVYVVKRGVYGVDRGVYIV